MTKKEELEQQGFKTYENDAICVFWKPGMCTHSGKCVMGNNAVFDPLRMMSGKDEYKDVL